MLATCFRYTHCWGVGAPAQREMEEGLQRHRMQGQPDFPHSTLDSLREGSREANHQ